MWVRRVVATLVDTVPLAMIYVLLRLLVEDRSVASAQHSSVTFTVRMIGVASVALYFPALMRLSNGQTCGKALVGIRVVRRSGGVMTVAVALWRDVMLKAVLLATLASIPGPLGAVGLLAGIVDVLWALFDREGRAIHDICARTRVVRVRLGDAAVGLSGE
jgi:uncharacterized RDD family membrane protein YckC